MTEQYSKWTGRGRRMGKFGVSICSIASLRLVWATWDSYIITPGESSFYKIPSFSTYFLQCGWGGSAYRALLLWNNFTSPMMASNSLCSWCCYLYSWSLGLSSLKRCGLFSHALLSEYCFKAMLSCFKIKLYAWAYMFRQIAGEHCHRIWTVWFC